MKMEHCVFIHALLLLLLMNGAMSLDARAGTGSVVARDTDKVSALRGKLSRLSDLLSYLEDGDENDLHKVAKQKTGGNSQAKAPVASEDMGVDSQKQMNPAPSLAPEVKKPALVNQDRIGLLSQDSSIQILSKALARLNDPKYNNGDSVGDYLVTENNEPATDSKNTQDMENIIARALMRLSQDEKQDSQNRKMLNPPGRPLDKSYGLTRLGSVQQFEDGTGSYLSHEPIREDLKQRDEVIRVVEARFMQDVLLANKLGISVDEIIRDLDNKVTMEQLEDKLNALNQHK